jgi:hypothetical protein
MFSPSGNGHHLGATPGTWEEPGNWSLARAPGPGGRHAGAGQAGRLARRCGEAGQGPSISYMEGPCLILPAGMAWPAPPRPPRSRRNAPPR